MNDYQDEELMGLFCQGNTSAFRILFNRYRDRVFRYICAVYERDRARAEEYTQDIFLRIIENRSQYNTHMQFSTWLFTVTRNHCKNQIRRKAARPNISNALPDFSEISDTSQNAKQQLQNNELGEIIREAVAGLPEVLRDIFVLREIESLPHAEIALMLNMQEGHVRTTLHRAKKQLQQTITPYIKGEL